mgnify:CR=1 FL=1
MILAVLLLAAQDWQTLDAAAWQPIAFKNHGEVRRLGDVVVLDAGQPMTGVKWTRDFPRSGYEIRWEARRERGNDFFAMITFPVGETHCSFITGGWGGDIVGLSTVDGQTAADNETRAYFNFENGRWYAFRVLVTAERIEVWINDERVVRFERQGHEFGLRRGDTELTTPLGFASYLTEGRLRNIRWRALAER